MNFNRHSNLEGQHAFLSASKYAWLNYDSDKLCESWKRAQAAQRGTELHAIACDLISHGIALPKTRGTLNLYVNDAIGYKMTPEQVLFFSENCFGTADAICFRNNKLRIHDLKTGEGPVSMHQLEIYAALFCLEYRVDPNTIKMELRIYQSNEVQVHEPAPEDIQRIMDKIISFDREIEQLKAEVA